MSNSWGEMCTLNVCFHPIGSPSQPRNVRVVSTGPTWASLEWDTPISPGFPSSAAMLYVILASRGEADEHQSPPTSNLSANITGLLPNSEYELTVLAQYVVDGIAANSTPSNLASTTTTTTGMHHMYAITNLQLASHCSDYISICLRKPLIQLCGICFNVHYYE